MENKKIREKFNTALKSIQDKIYTNKKIIAAFLLGSVSHDLIWEWSDLQILCVVDDSYKGASSFHLIECNVQILLDMRKQNEFLKYLQNTNKADFYYCAISKGRVLFTKDDMLIEIIQDYFLMGSREREMEMLLGFSEAVYHLNKVEKNFYVKENSENAVFFLIELATSIAWIEVAKKGVIPEREIILQARKFNPTIFEAIYDPLFNEIVSNELIEAIIKKCFTYLKDNTIEVYRPILSHLDIYGNLSEFSMKTRTHSMGINIDWLLRMGIVELYTEPIRIDGQSDIFYKRHYRKK